MPKLTLNRETLLSLSPENRLEVQGGLKDWSMGCQNTARCYDEPIPDTRVALECESRVPQCNTERC